VKILSTHLFVSVVLLTVMVFYFTLSGARHMHNEFERFLEARLQADLITNDANYRKALIDAENFPARAR